MGKLILMILRSQWDRATAILAVMLAGLVLLIGYFGVASTSYPAEQTPYIVSGGILGILLAAVGATLWLSADMRDEWRKLDELSEQLRAAGVEPVEAKEAAPFAGELSTVAARAATRRRKPAVQERRT